MRNEGRTGHALQFARHCSRQTNRNTQRTTVRVQLPEQSQGRRRPEDFKGEKSALYECFFAHFTRLGRHPWHEASWSSERTAYCTEMTSDGRTPRATATSGDVNETANQITHSLCPLPCRLLAATGGHPARCHELTAYTTYETRSTTSMIETLNLFSKRHSIYQRLRALAIGMFAMGTNNFVVPGSAFPAIYPSRRPAHRSVQHAFALPRRSKE